MIEPAQSIRKITFTSNQLKLADYRAKRLGLNFQEYIKHLISNDVKDILNDFDILEVNTLEGIEEGIDEEDTLSLWLLNIERICRTY